jgi:hypothetical protein
MGVQPAWIALLAYAADGRATGGYCRWHGHGHRHRHRHRTAEGTTESEGTKGTERAEAKTTAQAETETKATETETKPTSPEGTEPCPRRHSNRKDSKSNKAVYCQFL